MNLTGARHMLVRPLTTVPYIYIDIYLPFLQLDKQRMQTDSRTRTTFQTRSAN
jgi:hypothetical protein